MLKTSNKLTKQGNAGQGDLKYYKVIHGVRLTYFAKYDVNQMTVLETEGKISEPWNISPSDL